MYRNAINSYRPRSITETILGALPLRDFAKVGRSVNPSDREASRKPAPAPSSPIIPTALPLR
jgi:hypothetical protein